MANLTNNEVDDRARRTMRAMAWERAKGELLSMLPTFFGEQEKYDELHKKVWAFIGDVEGNGLQE